MSEPGRGRSQRLRRALSMYQDPEEREQQIRNISAAFGELTDGILPQLRRARMIINYEVVGRDDVPPVCAHCAR